jgi:two-component system response regulator DctR
MTERNVYIVDDDFSVQDSLSILLRSAGFNTECYSSGQEFLNDCTPGKKGCLLLDVQMPGMSGLELQQKLNESNIRIPTIVITAHGNVSTAVKAMKNGAFDFIEKPYREDEIIEKLEGALQSCSEDREDSATLDGFRSLYSGLTRREQEVFSEMIKGHSNKSTARILDISFRTVEIHRSHILQKMQVKNLSELIRKSILADLS